MSDSIPSALASRPVSAPSVAYLEEQLARFLEDETAVPEADRGFFRDLKTSLNGSGPVVFSPVEDRAFPPRTIFSPPGGDGVGHSDEELELAKVQERLDQLIRNHRVRGHIMAHVNPLGSNPLPPPELDPGFYGFSTADNNRRVRSTYFDGPKLETLGEIVDWLRQTYCRTIGVQFMHIDSLRVRNWLQERMESTGNRTKLSRDTQLKILRKLAQAVNFEEFLLKKYQGAKTFSLEGGETLIPLMEMAIEKCADDGVREIVVGMAHRGRLNVLANIMGKDPKKIFREFEDTKPEEYEGRGDVKYHLGFSAEWKRDEGDPLHLSLCFNPSHLEFVNPVAMGRMRAKQDRFSDTERDHGAVILIHGDAAFIGEGVVQESLNMSELPGYEVGGVLHIIVNNQIGFTTDPNESRSSTYATDVAKMLQVPIFHVNGEDPEAVAQAVELALDFRLEFQRDVVIDMYCYRRRGHNENDEPAFTQPLLYADIRSRESVYDRYRDQLVRLTDVTKEEADAIVEDERQRLEKQLDVARDETKKTGPADRRGTVRNVWKGFKGGRSTNADEPKTGLPADVAADYLAAQCDLPEDFSPHKSLKKFFIAQRAEMARGERPLNWAAAEAIAFASLLEEGYMVRLSGQDSERGTFSQRHTVLHDTKTGREHVPLKQFETETSFYDVVNSSLSENGILGFEYGYSLDRPDGLIMWEAQFGDFANAAQVIIDQFISSAEDKWDRLSSLVMLLPHGFEGQGPEHSSARLERFLQLCAEDNMVVAQPTTPAQYFHLLRRQTLRKWKKPLVVMTPKSLLRLPEASSSLEDLATGSYEKVIADPGVNPGEARRILLCSGKVYYELLNRRNETNDNVAIVRIEELYPVPGADLDAVFSQYPDDIDTVWVQEEPANMGAWWHWCARLQARLAKPRPVRMVARPESASPATGSMKSHHREQQALLDEAFAS